MHSFVLDHDYAWADGLICGGRMVVVAQPVRGPEPLAYFRSVASFSRTARASPRRSCSTPERPAASRWAARFLFDGEGDGAGQSAAGEVPEGLASRVVKPGRTAETVGPRWDRVLAELAANPVDRRGSGARRPGRRRAGGGADFDVWVVDDREQYANRERFPGRSESWSGPSNR